MAQMTVYIKHLCVRDLVLASVSRFALLYTFLHVAERRMVASTCPPSPDRPEKNAQGFVAEQGLHAQQPRCYWLCKNKLEVLWCGPQTLVVSLCIMNTDTNHSKVCVLHG